MNEQSFIYNLLGYDIIYLIIIIAMVLSFLIYKSIDSVDIREKRKKIKLEKMEIKKLTWIETIKREKEIEKEKIERERLEEIYAQKIQNKRNNCDHEWEIVEKKDYSKRWSSESSFGYEHYLLIVRYCKKCDWLKEERIRTGSW